MLQVHTFLHFVCYHIHIVLGIKILNDVGPFKMCI
jgi:hypothetical protein